MSDSLIERTLKSAETSTFAWPLADLARGFLHSGIQAPVEGATQLINHTTGSQLKALEIIKAAQPAPFLSASYNLQQLGGALGMLIPFSFCGKVLGLTGVLAESGLLARSLSLSGRVGKAAAGSLGMGESALWLEMQAGKLAFPAAKSALAGFVYDFTFHPVNETPNFWQDRLFNGLTGAAAFGTLEGSKLGLKTLENYRPFGSEMRRHFWSGLAAGVVDAETRSCLAGQGLTFDKALFESVYNFTVIGGALGAIDSYRSYKQSKITAPEVTPAESKIDTSDVPSSASVQDNGTSASTPSQSKEAKRLAKIENRKLRRQQTEQRRADGKAERKAEHLAAEALHKQRAQDRLAKALREERNKRAQKALQEQELKAQLAERTAKEKNAQRLAAEEKLKQQKLTEQGQLDAWKNSREAKKPADIWQNYKNDLRNGETPCSSNRGDKAQNELFNWVHNQHVLSGKEHPKVAALLELRQEVQTRMKAENWELVETNKHSIADRAGMDYILVNKSDGRYFFLDATLDKAGKRNLPELRLENVFDVHLQGTSNAHTVSAHCKRQFLELLSSRMNQESALNLKDTPPPNLSNKLLLEQSLNELDRFRADINRKCHYLDIEAKLCEADKRYLDAVNLRRTRNKLLSYNSDLNRVETYVRMKDQQLNDPSWARENASCETRVHKTLSKLLCDLFAGKCKLPNADTQSGDLILIDAQKRKFVFNQDADAIHIYERPQRARYEVSGVADLLQKQVSQAAAQPQAKGDAYALKRKLLSEGTGEHYSLLASLLESLSQIPSDVLLGRK